MRWCQSCSFKMMVSVKFLSSSELLCWAQLQELQKLSWAKLDHSYLPTFAVAWLRCQRPLVVIPHAPKPGYLQQRSPLRRISWFAATEEKHIGRGLPWLCIFSWERLMWVKGSLYNCSLGQTKAPLKIGELHLQKYWIKKSLIMSFW